MHRRRLPPAAAQHVEADVRRDAIQPRSQHRAALEALAATPGAQVRLLYRVLGVVEGREHPVAVDVQLTPVALGLRRESRVGHVRLTSCSTHTLPSGSAKSAKDS